MNKQEQQERLAADRFAGLMDGYLAAIKAIAEQMNKAIEELGPITSTSEELWPWLQGRHPELNGYSLEWYVDSAPYRLEIKGIQ